ncbi:hypothetical protein [Crocosphaera sp. XPORK-15E]|uniref:hypothetical protein n=1 Tax=Crocosphaera sp. XPORK-15E TaxID=3110247 RepID=UPI002B20ECCF|nr:hypothetical protein [Crocosphaera sp. XPORK-15E]MEA5535484.1 hypothetical protein [Crocosphaera sp. XPORK-15E]
MNVKNLDTVWAKRLLWVGIGITLTIFLVNFYLVGFGVYGDGIGYYTPLRSLIFDGDLKISNEYEYLSHSASNFGGGVRVDKEIPEYSKYTLGLGLVLSPFFALGHFATLILNAFGVDVTLNGLSWPYELFYCLGSIGLGITGLVICYKGARRFFSHNACILGVAGVWFASPLSFYLTLETSMSHAVSQFLISMFFYIWIATPWLKQRRQQVLMGLILGLAGFVRPQDILFAIVPILTVVWGLISRWFSQDMGGKGTKIDWIKSELLPLIIIGFVAVLMQLPQFLIYQWQFGSFFDIPYLQEGTAEGHQGSFQFTNPQILNVLFSGFHGLFSWHPLLFVSIIGLILVSRKFPQLVGIMLTAFAMQVYLVAAWWCWWQGSSFGGRMFANCSFIFVMGLAAFWDYFPRPSWQRFGLISTVFFMIWNGLLGLQYDSGMIPSEAPVTMGQIIQNQLFVLPYFLNHVFNR